MRVLAAILSIIVVLCPLRAWGGGCLDSHDARRALAKIGISPTALPQHGKRSSFKGLSLDETPDEAAAALLWQDYQISINSYINRANRVASFAICRRGSLVGRVDFDEAGRVRRITLNAGYFFVRPIAVREFADRVFRNYKVRPDEVADDACFQDVTCFRGHTETGEQFLILKIGGEIQLYVRGLRVSD